MKLAEQQAFPAAGATCILERTCMTYRQWLVGMALANLSGTNSPAEVGKACVAFADAAIDALEEPQ